MCVLCSAILIRTNLNLNCFIFSVEIFSVEFVIVS